MNTYDRILGGLYGIAIGDSMGMPVEMYSRSRVKQKYGKILGLMDGDPDNPISCSFRAGEITDDTIMSFLVCTMLIENQGEVNVHSWIDALREWIMTDTKSKMVVGPSTRMAIEKINSGMPPEEAGKQGVTNGASMKIAPLGLVCRPQNVERLIDNVHRLCCPTHNTSVAVSGAAAIAGAVSMATEGEKELNRIVDFALECARKGEKYGYEVLAPSVVERIKLIQAEIYRFRDEDTALDWIYNVIGAGLPVEQAVPAAFAVLLLGHADPLKCALLAANLGGDSDTIGSMCCAIAGAYSGIENVPMSTILTITRSSGLDFEYTAKRLLLLRR